MRANEADKAYRAMLIWLGRLEPAIDMRQLAERYGDKSLLAAVDALSMAVYGGAGSAEDAGQLADGLIVARQRFLSQSIEAAKIGLPPLNP